MNAIEHSSPVRISGGEIFFYQMLDVAEQVDLSMVEQLLAAHRKTTRMSLSRGAGAFLLRVPPLNIPLGSSVAQLGDQRVTLRTAVKIWDYGVLSFQFALPIEPGTPLEALFPIVLPAFHGFELEKLARQQAEELVSSIAGALAGRHDFVGGVRYAITLLEGLEGMSDPSALLGEIDVTALLLAEKPNTLSERMREDLLERVFQFGQRDLAVIDGKSALVVDPSGDTEVADVIEFARTQLLELRYYDDLLDRRLNELYDGIHQHKGLLRSRFAPLSNEAAARFIEFTHLVERLDNSLKVVGDAYLANLFRAAAEQFHLRDWKDSITRKLELLGRISELLQGQLNTHRGHILEIIVILLILLELIHAFIK
jgi:hypothetical protein